MKKLVNSKQKILTQQDEDDSEDNEDESEGDYEDTQDEEELGKKGNGYRNFLMHEYGKKNGKYTRSDYQQSNYKINKLKPITEISTKIPLPARRPNLKFQEEKRLQNIFKNNIETRPYYDDYTRFEIEQLRNAYNDIRNEMKYSNYVSKMNNDFMLRNKRRMDYIEEIDQKKESEAYLNMKTNNFISESAPNLIDDTSINKIVQKTLFGDNSSWSEISKDIITNPGISGTIKWGIKTAVSPFTNSVPIVGTILNSLVSSGVDWGIDKASKLLSN